MVDTFLMPSDGCPKAFLQDVERRHVPHAPGRL